MAAGPEEYAEYVMALAADFPLLAPLHNFVARAVMPRPFYWKPDLVTIRDLSKSGTLDKAEFRNVLPTSSQYAELATKLENVPDDLSTRIITVSPLTPTTAKLLGSRYDLSADFLSAHLPRHEIEPGAYICSALSSTLHINFMEAFCVDNVLSTALFPKDVQKLPGFNITNTPLWRLFNPHYHWYYEPFNVFPVASDADRDRQTLWFMMQQKVSIFIKREGTIRTIIILHYPVPILQDNWDEDAKPIPTRKGNETISTPSEWRNSSANGTTNNVGPSNLGEHLGLLLETHLPGSQDGSAVTLQQVFAALSSSVARTTVQVRQRVNDLGRLYKLQSEKPEDSGHGRDLLEMAEAARDLQECVRGVVEVLDCLPDDQRGQDTSSFSSDDLATKHRKDPDGEWSRLKSHFGKTLETLTRLTERARQLSQTRLVYMQIAESRKAIEQADGVRRLTTLAFIFIPLTYVASVFGADILEMGDTRTASNFAIASVVTTVATILAALYLEQHLWPAVSGLLNKWRLHVYTTMAALDDREKTFEIREVFTGKYYYWGSWNLTTTRGNWVRLPLATLDYGRLRWRQLLRKKVPAKGTPEASVPTPPRNSSLSPAV